MSKLRFALLGLVIAGTALPAIAQDRALLGSIKARQGQMQIISKNMGILGGMAKGEIAYDATAAARAASDLAAIGSLNQAVLWAEGSDSTSMSGNAAEAEIWDDWAGFDAKWQDFAMATAAAATTAGDGKEALGPIMGQIGRTCGACHDDYRTPR